MRICLLLITNIIFMGCGSEFDDAQMFPYDTKSWNRLVKSQEQPDGKIQEDAKVTALRGKTFYTYRTVYRIKDWKRVARKQIYYGKIGVGEIPNWTDNLRPEGEPKAGTYLPWLISNYDYETESVRIKLAPFDCFMKKEGNPAAQFVSYLTCFGDPPPVIKSADEGNTYAPFHISYQSWSWLDEKVLDLKLSKQDAEKLLNSISGSSFSVKVYYNIVPPSFAMRARTNIVWIEGFTGSGDSMKRIFQTNSYKPDDEEVYNRAGRFQSYWRDFTR